MILHRSACRRTAAWIALALLLLLLAPGGGCERDPGRGGQQDAPGPPVVETAKPVQRTVTEYFHYTGTLAAIERVEIRARVPGYLESIEFEDSTNVEAGDRLFVIEPEPYRVAVQRAEAAVARAEASRDLAEARRDRVAEARRRNAASEIELIEREAELRQAEADLLVAREMLASARLDLSYTQVRTPISGRVDTHYVDVGNLVGRDGATLLATVVRMDPIHVWFEVSESIALQYLSRGRDGTVDEASPPVEIGLADETGHPHRGRIDFVDNVLDSSTATLRVRGLVPNPTRKLYPGLFARVRVPFETIEDALLVRTEAVGSGLEGEYLLVVGEDDVVTRRAVTLGDRYEGGWRRVVSGIESDERYVVQGLQKARPGKPVDPRPWSAEEDEAEKGRTGEGRGGDGRG